MEETIRERIERKATEGGGAVTMSSAEWNSLSEEDRIELGISHIVRNAGAASPAKFDLFALHGNPVASRTKGVLIAGESKPVEKSHPIVAIRPVCRRNDPCPCGSGKKFKKCCRK